MDLASRSTLLAPSASSVTLRATNGDAGAADRHEKPSPAPAAAAAAALDERSALLGASVGVGSAAAANAAFQMDAGARPVAAASSPSPSPSPSRLDYLDQFRGFTMVSMILVNFLGDGGFDATPPFFKHGHFYISYPDMVMTGFLFATGLSYRFTHMRNIAKLGLWPARLKILVPRALGLLILAYWLYGFGLSWPTWDDMRSTPAHDKVVAFFFGPYFGALTQIALTMVWCLPVVERSILVRAAYGTAGLALYATAGALIGDATQSFDYLDGEEGGAYGFLSWSFSLLAGSITYDLLHSLAEAYPTPSQLPAKAADDANDDDADDAADELHTLGASGCASSPTAVRWKRRAIDVFHGVLGTPRPSSGAAPPPPAPGLEKRLVLLASAGMAMLVVGYLLSMLSLVVPVFCFDRASHLPTDCATVAFPLPPFIIPPPAPTVTKTLWSMLQCWPTFGLITTGFQITACVLCYWACDVRRWRVWGLHNIFDAFGRNTLLAYYFHFGARYSVAEFIPQDSPGGIVFLGLAMCLGTLYLAMVHLRRQKMFVTV